MGDRFDYWLRRRLSARILTVRAQGGYYCDKYISFGRATIHDAEVFALRTAFVVEDDSLRLAPPPDVLRIWADYKASYFLRKIDARVR